MMADELHEENDANRQLSENNGLTTKCYVCYPISDTAANIRILLSTNCQWQPRQQ